MLTPDTDSGTNPPGKISKNGSGAPLPVAQSGADTSKTNASLTVSRQMQQLMTRERSQLHQQNLFDRYSNRGSWAAVHTPLEQIGKTCTAAKKDSIHQQSWSSLPSRSFKLFQQLFCDREHFIVPANPKHIGEGLVPRFPLKEISPEWYSVLGCLVDPSRLTPALIRNLKLPSPAISTETTPSEDPYAATILALKYLWESLKPLPQNNNRKPNIRLLMFRDPAPAVIERYQQAAVDLGITIAPELKGTLFYIRGSVSADGSTDSRLLGPRHGQHFSSIHRAKRKTLHEGHHYSGEKQSLNSLLLRWEDFRDRELSQWVSRKQEEKLIESAFSPAEAQELRSSCHGINQRILTQYRSLLDVSLEALKHSVHPDKRKAEHRLEEMLMAVSGEQAQRINPNPAQLRIGANQTLLALRNEDITNKELYNSQDQYLVCQTIVRHQSVFESIRESIEQRAALVQEKRRLFNAPSLKQQEIYRASTALLSELALPIDGLRHIVVQPYLQYSVAIARSYQELQSALLAGKRDSAEDALFNMHSVTSLQHTQMAIESLLEALSADVINPLAIEKYRSELNNSQNRYQLFKGQRLFASMATPELAERIYQRSEQTAKEALLYIDLAYKREQFPRYELKSGLEKLLDDLSLELKR